MDVCKGSYNNGLSCSLRIGFLRNRLLRSTTILRKWIDEILWQLYDPHCKFIKISGELRNVSEYHEIYQN